MAHSDDVARRALVYSEARSRAVSRAAGRAFDILVAVFALVLLAPLFLLAALLIACEAKGPVFFAHSRIGIGGTQFKVLKFRTMRIDGDAILSEHLNRSGEAREEWSRDHKLRKDPRVTSLGRVLRTSSVDELPQLINVLRGEMSIVGPRPIVNEEIGRYGPYFAAYCSIRPGITGVWQISGRNDVSYQRRVEMDALYARKKSVLLDLRLVFATIPAVLMRKGSY